MNLRNEYFDPKKPGSFSGVTSFIKELKRRKKNCRAKKSGPPIKNEQAKRLRQKYAEQKSPNQ